MRLLLALDEGFGSLAAVAITSYLSHHRFESVVLVTPPDQRLHQLEAVAAAFDVPVEWQPIPQDAALHRLPAGLQPYFYCIEALQQREPGRYLCVDADTFCVAGLESLEVLPLDEQVLLVVDVVRAARYVNQRVREPRVATGLMQPADMPSLRHECAFCTTTSGPTLGRCGAITGSPKLFSGGCELPLRRCKLQGWSP